MEEHNQEQDDYSDDYYEHQEIKVDPKQSPLRIDKFLLDRMFKVSRNRIQNGIRAGSVLVNTEAVKPNYKVRPGDQITVILPRATEPGTGLVPEDIPLDIRYEDDDIVIVHKPPGLVVHPGVGHRSGTLVNALAYYFGKDLPVMEGNYEDRIGLVHRIDKDTSGLLLVAKNPYAMTHLAKQFFDHTIDRTYAALVWGEPEEETGSIEGNIGRHPRLRRQFAVFPEGETGKWARTHYRVIEPLYYVSLVECTLETGRTHQIRVHMQHIGHPLFSDSTYGGDRILKGTVYSKFKLFADRTFSALPRQALHARSLGFVHPRTGERMHFEADLPADFQQALDLWRDYVAGRKTQRT